MNHSTSREDREFGRQVEPCDYPISDFSHRAHLRLAYVYLVKHQPEEPAEMMRDSLIRLIRPNGVPPSKYHETLTRAWGLAVHHFMSQTDSSGSAEELIDRHPEMLDTETMMTHYSAEAFFTDDARDEFVQPDRNPIPRY